MCDFPSSSPFGQYAISLLSPVKSHAKLSFSVLHWNTSTFLPTSEQNSYVQSHKKQWEKIQAGKVLNLLEKEMFATEKDGFSP